MKAWTLIVSIALTAAGTAAADMYSDSFTTTSGAAVPDGGFPLSGLTSTLVVSGMAPTTVNVDVELNISGGYNGDLFAYLVGPHGGFAVLLNRVGRTSAGDISTYSDAGFDVTLSDSAANGDIHLYQVVFDPAGGVLTGTWQPDARNFDPATVTDEALRTDNLSSFEELDPNGTWSITLYDVVESGNPSTLESWSLNITAIPEPSTVSLGVLAAIVAGLPACRRRCTRARR